VTDRSGAPHLGDHDDPDLLRVMQHEEIAGCVGRVRPGGVLELR
jgi:hypothetical protein